MEQESEALLSSTITEYDTSTTLNPYYHFGTSGKQKYVKESYNSLPHVPFQISSHSRGNLGK